jgi:NADH dehydrogenase FAD-containing subunit
MGVEVRTGTAVEAVERAGGGLRVRARTGSQEVMVETGRLFLNEFLQSVSSPAVYAAGDAAAKGPPLTPVSSHDGKVVAAIFSKAIATGRTIGIAQNSSCVVPKCVSDAACASDTAIITCSSLLHSRWFRFPR